MTPETMSIEIDEAKARWLEERKTGIGASDAPVVAGISKYKTLLSLYCEKLGITEPPNVDTEAAEWGILLEEPVAQKYAKVTGRLLEYPGPYTIQRSEQWPFATCTIDRFIVGHGPIHLGQPDFGRGVLQIKTTSALHEDEWSEGPPPAVYCQVQHEMAVTRCQWGSAAVLVGGQKFRWADVPRDDSFIEQLMAREAWFWGLVQSQTPPEPDAGDKDTLARLFPRDTGEVIELSGEFLTIDEQLLQVKGQIDPLYREKERLENLIRAALGDASIGVLPNGVKYTNKAQTRASYVVPESTFRVLRRSAK